MDVPRRPDVGSVAPDAADPVAIIDIGSNSVRLVAYLAGTRAPTPIYNEKLLCGLGRGVATTGRLPADAVERALRALTRFRLLCDLLHVRSVRVLATAAARDAENGAAFLADAERACGAPVELLTGEREAALSAAGVISGTYRPDGIVGDLGGGSLELVDVTDAAAGRGMTLPLGGLALQDLAGGSAKKAARLARDELRRAPDLSRLAGRTFYAVGGTWRALARLDMIERGYPLRIMHGYEFDLGRGDIARLAERAEAGTAKQEDGISEARRPLLIYGALVLDEIVRAGRPAKVSVSALGVREGLLYEMLGTGLRDSDPLLAAAAAMNAARARSPRHGVDLQAWTDVFMAGLGLDETGDERRLRHTACLLSDTEWRAHPEYRAECSLALAQEPFIGIDHPGRAFVGLAVFFRHAGLVSATALPPVASLASSRLITRARLLGALFRIAFPMSVAMGGVLPRTPLTFEDGRIALRLPSDLTALSSERLANRLRGLARLLDVEARLEIA